MTRSSLALSVLLALSSAACAKQAEPARFAMTVPPYRAGARFVVVGDIQRTAPVLEFWREQNDVERARVIAALARERPDLVLVTGDCVFDGGSDDQWAAFDRLTAPLREAGVPVASAFGNHEYWSGRAQAERHLLPRFPLDGGRHWFVVAMGPLRLVVLDSNLDELTTADQAEELAWYEDALDRFDRDPSVRGVLVAFHHPPFTNSTVTGDEPLVQRFFLPPFERARKTLALLNGHVHSYERFARGAKTYVVSGGGGGPRASLETGAARRHGDDRYDGPSLRDFNFSVYTVSDRGVGSEVRGLAKGGASFTVIDRFFLPWPSDEAPPPRPAGLIARSADRR